MKRLITRKPALIALIGIISLIASGVGLYRGATLRHQQGVLQPLPESQFSEPQLAAITRFEELLVSKKSFFAARFHGCFAEKQEIICDVFYPSKNQKNEEMSGRKARWTKAQTQLNKMGPHGRIKLKNKILKSDICQDSYLISALAFKWEEQLPNSKALEETLNLYEKAYTCAQENDFEERGLYRWGLLSVWVDDLESATTALSKFLEISENNSLKSRAQFWLNNILKSQGQKIASKELKAQWMSFPLSYHIGEDVQAADLEPLDFVVRNQEPEVQTRSKKHEKINHSLAFIEHFAKKDRFDIVERVYDFFDFKLLAESEPEVQLYVASLLEKYSKNNHNLFLVLSRLFQQYPEYKTLANMKMYYPTPFKDIIINHRSGQDPALIISLIRQESSFNTQTISPVGARGLMQIMPATAKELSKKITDKDLLVPEKNIPMGARYLRALLREFKGDTHKALAAYNAGSGNVRKWSKRYLIENPLLFADLIPFDETREYVSSILRNRYWYSRLYPEFQVNENIALKENAAQ